MNKAAWRRTIRLTALLVLLNVALGLIACLGDTPELSAAGSGATLTNRPHRPQTPVCGDDCDSCVRCASLVLTQPIRFAISLTVSSKATVLTAAAPAGPERHTLKRPPRA